MLPSVAAAQSGRPQARLCAPAPPPCRVNALKPAGGKKGRQQLLLPACEAAKDFTSLRPLKKRTAPGAAGVCSAGQVACCIHAASWQGYRGRRLLALCLRAPLSAALLCAALPSLAPRRRGGRPLALPGRVHALLLPPPGLVARRYACFACFPAALPARAQQGRRACAALGACSAVRCPALSSPA